MTENEERQGVERKLVEAEQKQLEEFKTQMAQLLERTEKEFESDLNLSDAQREWVQKRLEEILKEEKILKDSQTNNEYEEFTEGVKDALKPAIEQGLALNAAETTNSAIASHLQGTFYGEVQTIMEECRVKKFRGFCKLTGYSHTTVYRKVKIAKNYTKESLANCPGVDLKALYEVAAQKGADADEVLRDNHTALVQAGSDIHEVRKVLDPKYKPVKTIVEPDGIAMSPDERLKAEFHLRKAQIMIKGVSENDWADFQLWFDHQGLWNQFRVWKKLKEDELELRDSEDLEEEEDTSTQVYTQESKKDETEPLNANELFAVCDAQWNDPQAREDDGTINVAHLYGVNNLTDPGWLKGEVFIKYGENGTEHLFRKNIFAEDVPLTSQQLKDKLQKIRQDYPQVTAVMFADDEERLLVGTKMLDGNPVSRWRLA